MRDEFKLQCDLGSADQALGVQQPWDKLLTPAQFLISCTEFYFCALKFEVFVSSLTSANVCWTSQHTL